MIEPSINPNLNQILFGYTSNFDKNKATNKNTKDKINAQILSPSELIIGYRDMIKNTIEKTKPKDFSEDISGLFSILIWCIFIVKL